MIAGDSWRLKILYTPKDSTVVSSYSITFLPTGDVDNNTSDFDAANALLAPTINLIHKITGNSSLDIWKLINWMWVSYYWTLLYQFGSIAPTTYDLETTSKGTLPAFTGFGYPDFSKPIQYEPTNNIFYNQTLFEIYSTYLFDTLIPIYTHLNRTGKSIPTFLPFTNENRIEASPVSILTTYSCTIAQLKNWANGLVSVAVADWAFITGAYHFFIWIGGLWGHFAVAKKDQPNGNP